jgi:LuxR family maltose regulon positive regulatory protein
MIGWIGMITQIESNRCAKQAQTHAAFIVETLSRREFDVLRLIAEGYANREIAQHLTISINTVKMHIRHIYSKLGVRNRVQAITRARELRMI